MKKIFEIFRLYKVELSWIYLFMLLTELSNLTIPFLLGKSIDALMVGNFKWIVLLGFTYYLSNLFNYKRMVYDTKTYTKIYNDLVLKFLKTPRVNTSAKIARTDMTYQIVHMMEGYVHYYISTIVTIIGSIGFIYSENWKVGVLVSISLLFILFSVNLFQKKIKQSVFVRNNHDEKKLQSIKNGYQNSFSFFNRKRRLEIIDSNLQGKNWLSVGLIKNTFLLLSIILLVTTNDTITVGSVITVYSYVDHFLVSLLSIPVAIEMYSRMTDIFNRID